MEAKTPLDLRCCGLRSKSKAFDRESALRVREGRFYFAAGGALFAFDLGQALSDGEVFEQASDD